MGTVRDIKVTSRPLFGRRIVHSFRLGDSFSGNDNDDAATAGESLGIAANRQEENFDLDKNGLVDGIRDWNASDDVWKLKIRTNDNAFIGLFLEESVISFSLFRFP